MTTWLIEPRDPLIVRDGRPFGPDPGARAESLPFPFPSTTSGGIRTQAGKDADGVFPIGDQQLISKLLGMEVRGPLLVDLDEEGEVASWLFPAPADALLLKGEDEGTARLYRLVPLELPEGAATDLTATSDNGQSEMLAPVGLTEAVRDKPYHPAPRFWNQRAFYDWLQDATRGADRGGTHLTELSPADLGHGGPLRDQRLHVRLDPETLAAVEGFLFLTEGRAFARPRSDAAAPLPPVHMALAVQTDAELKEGIAPLGGERRLMRWYRSKEQAWPEPPEGLLDTISQEAACRLLLLTPAHFERGWRPSWLLQQSEEAQVRLAATAIGRPQVVSGWDFERNQPKPSRRLAPAGSVFFLRLGPDREANRRWAEAMWMSCVSDDDQSRKDGFGLVVLGSWSGQLAQIKENSV